MADRCLARLGFELKRRMGGGQRQGSGIEIRVEYEYEHDYEDKEEGSQGSRKRFGALVDVRGLSNPRAN